MDRPDPATPAPPDAADPDWFRPPTRREHWLGFALFTGFGVFFVLLFLVQRRWWFSWVTLALAVVSTHRGLQHARSAMAAGGAGRAGRDRG
jgi:hypothetical protein